MSKTSVLKECGFIKTNGIPCDKAAKFGRRCNLHKGKRNKGGIKKKTEAQKAQPAKKQRRVVKERPSKEKAVKETNSANIKFWDVASGKHVSIPKKDCKIKRSKGRGGDQLIGFHQGRKLFTYVPRGFQL